MKKILFPVLFLLLTVFANDNLHEKQKNVLYVQNLIDIEEKIATEYEKYLLVEFKIPTMSDLTTKEYLGVNFSNKNIFGNDIDFKDALNLEVKLAIDSNDKDYLQALYNRDLYRDRTSVFIDGTTSYVLITLKSQEAKNIHSILQAGNSINKNCLGEITSKYCSKDINTIRWYNANGNWIEYDKKGFENTNITIQNSSVLNDIKIDNLKVGSYIFLENGYRYIKVVDSKMRIE